MRIFLNSRAHALNFDKNAARRLTLTIARSLERVEQQRRQKISLPILMSHAAARRLQQARARRMRTAE